MYLQMFQVSNKIKEGCERAFGRGDTSIAACREILEKLEILHGKKVARGCLVELVFVVRSVMYS